jgi:hypothetical protein
MGFVNGQPADAGEQAPFFTHYGHFLWQFSQVERLCHFVFHQQSGLEESVARALIGGEQLSKVTRLLNSLIKAKGDTDRIIEMQFLIDQINVISQLRHDLVHRGADTMADGTINVSNRMTAKSLKSIEILRLNLEHIKGARGDLECVAIRLALFGAPTTMELLDPQWTEILAAPWRYKRVEPNKPHQPRRGNPQ